MYRTHSCGELTLESVGQEVTLAGWIQRVRRMGAMSFIDLRDRYGITQLVIESDAPEEIKEMVDSFGREFVIKAKGRVVERSSKNRELATGEIEIKVEELELLNSSEIPPFTIEEESDGGEELRAKYRYLDLRRAPLQRALELRHRMAQEVRGYLDGEGFIEIETPFLIKSTPEGARDFVVPSRLNRGEFYALPQSPQTFKQLLMIAGYDKYFQIVRCFRDEDLRADRQPEFTQIDCELSFVGREDILKLFEGMIKSLFKRVLNVEIEGSFPRISYQDAIKYYGSDKPDIRFGMKIVELKSDSLNLLSGGEFPLFDSASYIGAINVEGGATHTRKELDQLTAWVKRPQIGASALFYIRVGKEEVKSSVDKFYGQEQLLKVAQRVEAKEGDLILILAGEKSPTQSALGALRIEMGQRGGLRDRANFAPLWVYDFPLFEWDDESGRFYAMHHPFTAPKPEEMEKFYSDDRATIASISADAYDFVLNGSELGGGSIRIHNSKVQKRMFEILGFTPEQIEAQFGFIVNAFKYGAPPHGGIAFGFDRFCALFGGEESIREFIAFPKNSSARDVMLDAPSKIDESQLKELHLKSEIKEL